MQGFWGPTERHGTQNNLTFKPRVSPAGYLNVSLTLCVDPLRQSDQENRPAYQLKVRS